MLQNATLLRISAPRPPTSSDEHVSCTAPATENASLQILFKCPTTAIVFGKATKPSRFAHFWHLHNPLHLPHKTTSERQKVVRACGVFNMFTSRCASRHNGVHFFDIATSKSVPNMRCFVHFDFEKFASRHNGVHSAAQLLKVLRSWGVLYILTWKLRRATTAWPAGSAPAALASLLFDPPEHKSWEKTQGIATFLPFRAPGSWIFFLLRLSLSSSLLFSDSLSISAFHLSILSEVWLPNFLRLSYYPSIHLCFPSIHLSIYLPTYLSTYLSIYHLISQSINQPINQSINQSINQPINQSTNQSSNQPTNQSINQPINQSVDQSINQCVFFKKVIIF